MVPYQEDGQGKADVRHTADYSKQSCRTLLNRGYKMYLYPFDFHNAVLTGLPQPSGIQSRRKPRVSEIWGYKRWLTMYQNITLIQLFKQRCIRTAALSLLQIGWHSPPDPDKKRPWGCISSSLTFVTTSKNSIATLVRTPATSLPPVSLHWECRRLNTHSEIKTWTSHMNS